MDTSNSKSSFPNLLPCHIVFTYKALFLFWDLSKSPPSLCFSYYPLHHYHLSLWMCSFPWLIWSHITLYISFSKLLVGVFFLGFLCMAYYTLKTPIWPKTSSEGQKFLHMEKHLTLTLYPVAITSFCNSFQFQNLAS